MRALRRSAAPEAPRAGRTKDARAFVEPRIYKPPALRGREDRARRGGACELSPRLNEPVDGDGGPAPPIEGRRYGSF